jgi:hypothetical protein
MPLLLHMTQNTDASAVAVAKTTKRSAEGDTEDAAPTKVQRS